MATLKDLKPSITDMTDDELREHITNIRAARRIRPKTIKKNLVTKKSVVAATKALKSLDSMSQEDLAQLLATLEEKV